MKEKVLKTIHDWLQVIFYLCFIYTCTEISMYFTGDRVVGFIVGVVLFGVYLRLEKD